MQHVQLAIFGAGHAPTTLTGSCGGNPGIPFRPGWDGAPKRDFGAPTHNLLSRPRYPLLRVAYVLALAFLIRAVLHRVINRITERATDSILPQFRNGVTSSLLASNRLLARRRRGGGGAKTAVPAESVTVAPAEAEATA